MTFYEAALRVLETEGRPLTFQEITDRSIQQNLLSHIGKTPELTMLSRLLAMARRKTDRKVVVTEKDTFALVDWALPEGPDALNETAKAELREEENLPPLRPPERHPEPRSENVRIAGRGAERKRHREDDDRGKRKKKFPPIAEVVFELLSDGGQALRAPQLAERARERELAGTELTDEAILTALLEDNQRRIDAGRRPQFVFDAASKEISLERASGAEVSAADLQAAFATALGIPMEGGRPLLARPAQQLEVVAEIQTAVALLKTAARDAKRTSARALRKRLSELESGTFEKAMVKVLHALGFRELKAAKRSKEGPLFTARKREGSLELRYAIRILKGTATVDRKSVQELRRDLGHYGAQVGLIACPGEVRGDAKSEATSSGALVFLWASEALAEKFFEAEVGVTVTRFEAYELDDRFFDAAKVEAEEAQRRREERRGEKQEREERRPRRTPEEPKREEPKAEARPEGEAAEAQPAVEGEAPPDAAPAAAVALAEPLPTAADAAKAPPVEDLSDIEGDGEGEGEEGEDEGEEEGEGDRPEGAAAAPGQPQGERRRRRRRRRGRRGRGNKPQEGAQAQGTPGPTAPGEPGSPPPENGRPAANVVPAPVPAAAPEPPPPSGGGDGNQG